MLIHHHDLVCEPNLEPACASDDGGSKRETSSFEITVPMLGAFVGGFCMLALGVRQLTPFGMLAGALIVKAVPNVRRSPPMRR